MAARLKRFDTVLATQPDLFGAPRPAGFSQADAIVTPAEERVLIASIDAAGLSPFRFHGWEGKRLTASFGWRYDFDDATFAPAEPIPAWLMPVRERAAQFAGLDPASLVQALVIRYDTITGIHWHRDRPVFAHMLKLSLRPRPRCDSAGARMAVSSAPWRGCFLGRSIT